MWAEGRIDFLESSRRSFVTFNGSNDPALAVSEVRFEGGQSILPGRREIYTGAVPGNWDLPAPESLHESTLEVGQAVLDLARRLKHPARIHYSSVSSVRVTIGTTVSPTPRDSQVWALTGEIRTPNGRLFPLGRSGRGDGLSALRDECFLTSLIRGVEAVDRALPCSASNGPVVLSPSASAVMLHEAVGHFAEASDRVHLQHRLGFRVASDLLTLHDDPLVVGGIACYESDDEDVASLGPTEVLREGRLIAQLHSMASARAAGTSPTANGRSVSAWMVPIPRMSNLVCPPHRSSEDELIENLGTGLYVHRLADGRILRGTVSARVVLAERVQGARRTKAFVTTGSVMDRFDALKRVVEVGAQSRFNLNAMCGKDGQVLFDVGTSSPAVRMSSLRIVP